jgi:hypothetical protein
LEPLPFSISHGADRRSSSTSRDKRGDAKCDSTKEKPPSWFSYPAPFMAAG